MRNILYTFILLNFQLVFGQIEEASPIIQPLKFKKVNNPIFNGDSLVVVKNKIDFKKEVFKDSLAQMALRRHNRSVFYYSNASSKKVYNLHQWTTPIVVYFDKSIPKYLKKSLSRFIVSFKDIENLTITLTKNIDEANYLIKSSDKEFKVESYELKNEEKEQFTFNNGKYEITRGGYSRIKSCVLSINANSDKTIIIEKSLKQLFFLSLGRFFLIHNEKDVTSLISPIYESSDILNKLDVLMLKIQYNYIFNESINSTEFNKILRTYL